MRSNKGSSGVDGMEVDELRQWIGGHLKELQTSILQEQYEVGAVRKVEIPKPTGGMRMLGIPTVKDRLVQQAIHQELNRYYEPYFSDHSYGFRTGRSAGQAIVQASDYIAEGREWVVDIDLEKFFDTINHDRLMQRLSKGIGDKRLLRLINAYLKTGIMTGGNPISCLTNWTENWRKEDYLSADMPMTAIFLSEARKQENVLWNR